MAWARPSSEAMFQPPLRKTGGLWSGMSRSAIAKTPLHHAPLGAGGGQLAVAGLGLDGHPAASRQAGQGRVADRQARLEGLAVRQRIDELRPVRSQNQARAARLDVAIDHGGAVAR